MRTSFLALLALVATPSAAFACGGFFCNNSQPVNQSAERILFAPDGSEIHMHVQVAYSGPPQDFGWLLPVPAGVQVELGTEMLFTALDLQYGPRFRMNAIFDGDCAPPPAPLADGDPSNEGAGGRGGVQVLSREPLGPYDRAILAADDVQVLRTWLDDNGYQIPEAIDAKLAPYIQAGAVFVAIKLLPDNDVGDLVPLRLTFPAPRAVIPIVPTAVAAEPDMGILVHVLGDSRAIPLNYRHVRINEAALDLRGGGNNYVDVVAQAVDEAGGKAFATDFAGPIDEVFTGLVQPLDVDLLGGLATVRDVLDQGLAGDTDVQRLINGQIELPDGTTTADFWNCPFCYDDVLGQAIDGAALAAQVEAEVNPARVHLADVFSRHGYLTRLFSTMSADEMDLDPEFEFNADAEPVANVRVIDVHIPCVEGSPAFDEAEVTTGTGDVVVVNLNDQEVIRRQGGVT
ncbi:MAG: DUF2330 domain-containing protein, partial [Myxococcales bacterium]|nr:DUF2330 domain-containing protein [Myxococcales bacterium]